MASLPRITVHDYITPSERSRGSNATYSVGIMNLTRDEVTLIRSFALTLENGRERPALRGAEIDRAWSEGISNMSDEERRVAAEMATAARLSSNVVPEGATDAAQRRDRDIELTRARLEEAFGYEKAFAWSRAMRLGTVSVQSFEDATRWINGGSWINGGGASAPNTTAGSSGSIKTRYLQGEWGPRPAEFYEEMARDAARQEEPEEERNRFSGLDLDG